jgi:hypothetical protein
MQKKTIQICSKWKKDLMSEFETSLVTVQLSLDYANNSQLAINIRKRAVEMLKNEIERIQEIEA